jgi:hypothetical protein
MKDILRIINFMEEEEKYAVINSFMMESGLMAYFMVLANKYFPTVYHFWEFGVKVKKLRER